MVPELGFSVQRQWFPKKSDRNVVCHSPKLKLRKFPFLASLSLKWKCWTENEKLQMHARVRLPLCYLVRDFCVAVLLSASPTRAGSLRAGCGAWLTAPASPAALELCFGGDAVFGRTLQPQLSKRAMHRNVTARDDKNGLFSRVQGKFGSYSFLF